MCSRKTQKHFWGAVKSRLDVSIYGLSFVARRAKVDDFDNRAFETTTSRQQGTSAVS